MPLLATGYQAFDISEVLPPLVEASVKWHSVGLRLQTIRIAVRDRAKADSAARMFRRLKDSQQDVVVANDSSRTEYDVFVSYAHEDRDAARKAADELSNHRWRVFVDELSLDKGASWQQHIFSALDRSRGVLSFYSPAYINSKVCQEEYNIAWARTRKSPQNLIFPIYWRSANLPTYMEMLNFVDCREVNLAKVENACATLISELSKG